MAIVHVVAKSQIGLEQLTLMSPVISGEGYDAWLKLSTCLFVKQKKKKKKKKRSPSIIYRLPIYRLNEYL